MILAASVPCSADTGSYLDGIFEAGFVSTAHTPGVIDETLEVVRAAALEVA